MKLNFIPVFFIVLLGACNNDKKVSHTQENEDGSVTTTSYDLNKVAEESDEITKKTEELKNLKPLSLEELKAFLPEQVNGIPRSSYNTNSTMGFAMAEGDYKKDDTTNLKVVIYDCAGEAGSGIYAMNFWTRMNVQSESSSGYTKTFDFMGGKAVETYENNSNQSTLTYLANERLLVVLTGRNMKGEQLRDAAKMLNLKVS